MIVPGHNHIDVMTAARRQHDGRPEPSRTALMRSMLKVVGGRSK